MKKIFLFLFICFVFACKTANTGGNDGDDKSSLKIGDKGPGGGIVFHIEGNKAWEVSENLGEFAWERASKICENYRGGGFSDWYLPSFEELNWVHESLVRSGNISDRMWYWSSTPYDEYNAWGVIFLTGYQFHDNKHSSNNVRAVRTF